MTERFAKDNQNDNVALAEPFGYIGVLDLAHVLEKFR